MRVSGDPSADDRLEGSCRRALCSVLLAAVAANLGFALFPFRLDIPGTATNGVQREGDGSLAFSSRRNDATTAVAPTWLGSVIAGSSLGLHLVLRTAASEQFGPARILTVSADYRHSNITVAQEGPDLVVRVRRPGSTDGGTPPHMVPDVFADGGWRDVRIDVGAEGLRVEVDGQQRLLELVGAGATRTWDPSYRLALGDELIGGRPWSGQVRRASIVVDATRADYVEPGQLVIPPETSYVPARLREPQRLARPSEFAIAGLHLAGFVPIGLVLVPLMVRRFGPLAWLSACLLFVTVLQQGKVFMAGRHPSTIDMAACLAGCVVGALLWRGSAVRRLLASDRRQQGRT